MLKKFEKVVVYVFLAAIILTGCSQTDANGNKSVDDRAWFYRIGDTPLVYEKNTKIMYYRDSYGHQGYMSPYYNEHGQMCYYVDGQIIPIEEVLIDAD